MFSRKSMPIGALFMILVIALAVLGVGYSLWSETLTIQGTVQTGEVDVEFSMHPVQECVDVNGVETCPEPPDKAAAANCTVQWIEQGDDSAGDDGADLLQVTVTGMYPSYHCKVGFDVTSTGNVPVHVWLPEAVGAIPEWVNTNFEGCYAAGTQLHQGQSTGICTMDIHFTNEQAPVENSGPITFGWTILATQFNELPAEWVRVQSPPMAFSSTGMAGWSCPAGTVVMGGGTVGDTQPVALSQPAKPGVGTYPVYPHYTYTPPEEGWVVQNGPTPQTMSIYALCAP